MLFAPKTVVNNKTYQAIHAIINSLGLQNMYYMHKVIRLTVARWRHMVIQIMLNTGPWQHQAVTWHSVCSVVFAWAIAQEVFMNLICNICSTITV